MTRYFGTDGIRGKANETLKPETALSIGKVLGWMSRPGKQKILIGRDTRPSGDFLEHALAAGASSMGAEVHLAGVIPTGAVSLLMQDGDYDFGVVISASHNPFWDNGIKIFSADGSKLDDSVLDMIEDGMDGLLEMDDPEQEELGRILTDETMMERYLDHLDRMVDLDLSGMTIALDLANGASGFSVPALLKRKGADVKVIHDLQDGLSINVGSGSTHPQALSEFIRENGADIGFAFDGDADRLIIIDRNGRILSGDHYLYILAKAMLKAEKPFNRIVTTQMANLGLKKALEKLDIPVVLTDVGDRYVYEKMVEGNDPLGGEQSGHMIFLEHATTGDGLLSALKFLEALDILGMPLEELADEVTIYPQILYNIRTDMAKDLAGSQAIATLADELEEGMHGQGRIFLRASGTEPLYRIMVEAETQEKAAEVVDAIAALADDIINGRKPL